jgi:hypothetical protein
MGKISGEWYPSNAREQTSICTMLNQRSFFATYAGQSMTRVALPYFHVPFVDTSRVTVLQVGTHDRESIVRSMV